MAYRRKSRGPKGRKCSRYKRVRVRGMGMARRCAKFGPKRSGGSKRKRRSYAKRRRGSYKRKPRGMARRGSTCKRYKTVRLRGSSKRVRRCASYR